MATLKKRFPQLPGDPPMLKPKCASIHSNNDQSMFVNGMGLSMTHTSRATKTFHDYSIDVITDSFSKHTGNSLSQTISERCPLTRIQLVWVNIDGFHSENVM